MELTDKMTADNFAFAMLGFLVVLLVCAIIFIINRYRNK